jgi:Rrf2 family protein
MFRVSRRLDYGLQLMIALAKDESNRPQATALLSEHLHIPLPFLHQIGRALIQGGLIKATPGPHGGLRLSHAAERMTLLQIIETLEGPVRVMPEPNGTGNGLASRAVWEDLQGKLTAYMGCISLKELATLPHETVNAINFNAAIANAVASQN